uniref:Cilia- and flagella-associated protein 251 n=1 Tax=Callorhinchus milii TaxID=7868 RepID=A0A4W3HV19_CALMI
IPFFLIETGGGHSAPLLFLQTFNKTVGLFSQSVFHHNPSQALTATSAGNLVIWDTKSPPEISLNAEIKSYKKKALKLVHLQNDGITVVTFSDRYVVTGDVKGVIKFYSEDLNIMNWYSNFNLGPINSISFSKRPAAPASEKTSYPSESTIKAQQFVVRNFIVATTDATVVHVTGDGCKLEILLQEHNFPLHAICCHPTYPILCMGSYSGLLKLWNYEEKKYISSRIFGMGNYINCVAFDNTGTLLGIGVTDGSVHILNAFSLTDECKEPFQYAKDAITQITFSHDSQYLATVDSKTTVTVFVLRRTSADKVWKYLGKHTSHFKPIQTLTFGIHLDTKEPRLLSLGEDRVLVSIEYDLANSTKYDLRILNSERIEQSAVPMCMAWYPPITTESFIVVANDQYKLKLYNATTKMCRFVEPLSVGLSIPCL